MSKEFEYMRVMNYFEERILSGELKKNELLPSEIESAQFFGVSRITTKRAFEELRAKGLIYRVRGKGSFVAFSELKESLLHMVQENSRGSNTVVLVLPSALSLGKSLDMFHRISTVLEEKNMRLALAISDFSSLKEREIILQKISEGVAGMILYPVSNTENTDLIYQMYLENIPLVIVDRYFEGIPLNGVYTDNFKGSYMAASHLISLGHQEIAFVSDNKLNEASSVRDRYFGFSSALKDNELPTLNQQLIFVDRLCNEKSELVMDYTLSRAELLDPFKYILENLLNRPKAVTALQAINDYVAIIFMKAALQLGVKLPEELSIIGFDNIESCSYVEVPLTTIEQDFAQLGTAAAHLILNKIEEPDRVSQRVHIPVKLVVRSSTIDIKSYSKK